MIVVSSGNLANLGSLTTAKPITLASMAGGQPQVPQGTKVVTLGGKPGSQTLILGGKPVTVQVTTSGGGKTVTVLNTQASAGLSSVVRLTLLPFFACFCHLTPFKDSSLH